MAAVKINNNSALTFSVEGSANPKSPYYTRKAHWPGSNSGVTIGKGYDMKEKSKAKVKKELIEAKLTAEDAEKLSEGALLSGTAASDFIKKEDIKKVELTEEQEIYLFNLAYAEAEKDVKRICTKTDVEKKYGKCDWSKIDDGIKEFVIDLKFRGDYSGKERTTIQKAIITNNYDELIKHAEDKDVWKKNLDTNRFTERIRHLKSKKQIFNLSRGKASNASTN